jgi:VIT1/CCC1 family predicted Fe2+/Mn2+ transporter
MNPLAMVTADRSGRTRHRPEQWHDEAHTSHRAPRLRAAVLGANDGLLSTSSLVVGVAAAGAQRSVLLATGVAALISGAASMAMGEVQLGVFPERCRGRRSGHGGQSPGGSPRP